MKPINDYIVERIRIDNVINNKPYKSLGRLKWVLDATFTSEHGKITIECDDWYYCVVRYSKSIKDNVIVFWSPKSKWMMFIRFEREWQKWTICKNELAQGNPDDFYNSIETNFYKVYEKSKDAVSGMSTVVECPQKVIKIVERHPELYI